MAMRTAKLQGSRNALRVRSCTSAFAHVRLSHTASVLISLTILLLVSLLTTRTLTAQNTIEPATRTIMVSLEENRLWLVDGGDTILSAPVAVGRREAFRYGGKLFVWRTPTGQRAVLAKRREPVWSVPEWHYYERAANENLKLVNIIRGRSYSLKDGTHLTVRGDEVVRVRGQQFWKVPRGHEIIIDGVLFAPPAGTVQRRVPGALGTRALDLGEGYLIHGTSSYNESSVGGAASHGCIRMKTGDVERLYDLVKEGTPVLIF